MKHLYLDNMRGFSNTIVPLTDVNFFVGENSTGKTSVLRVLRLISSPRFWFEQKFDMEDVKFGHFHDIVSVHTNKRNYFSIGLFVEGERSENHEPESESIVLGPQGFLATYTEYEGQPKISRFTFIDQGKLHTLRFTKSGVLYKSENIFERNAVKMIPASIFKRWVKEHRNQQPGYKQLPFPEDFPIFTNVDLIIAITLLKNLSSPDETEPSISGPTLSIAPPSTSLESLVWIAPIRSQPRRTYDEARPDYSPEGDHTPYLIKKILDSKREAKAFQSFMRRVGKSSGLFEAIGIKRYGSSVTAPFELDIILDKKALNLRNVGYGVSQSLPVLVEILTRPKGTWFAVQQPEVHLHPRAQAALGDVFFELATQEQKCFFIETHSDYAIDRFRMNYRRRQDRRPSAQILFFERKNSRNVVSSIAIEEDGEISTKQPASYRRFFMKEQLRALGI